MQLWTDPSPDRSAAIVIFKPGASIRGKLGEALTREGAIVVRCAAANGSILDSCVAALLQHDGGRRSLRRDDRQVHEERRMRRTVFGGIALASACVFGAASANAQAQRWFRGNTHTHTLNSDGDSPPDSAARWYRDHGYAFLFITDHETLTDPGTAQCAFRKARRVSADPRTRGHAARDRLGARGREAAGTRQLARRERAW